MRLVCRFLALSVVAVGCIAPSVHAQEEDDVDSERKPSTFDAFLAAPDESPEAMQLADEPEAAAGAAAEALPDAFAAEDSDAFAAGEASDLDPYVDEVKTSAPDIEGTDPYQTDDAPVAEVVEEKREPTPPLLVGAAVGLASGAAAIGTFLLFAMFGIPPFFLTAAAAMGVVHLLTDDFDATLAVGVSGLAGVAIGAILVGSAATAAALIPGNVLHDLVAANFGVTPASLLGVWLVGGAVGGILLSVPVAAGAAVVFSPGDAE